MTIHSWKGNLFLLFYFVAPINPSPYFEEKNHLEVICKYLFVQIGVNELHLLKMIKAVH